jgi:GDP-mannose 6-dehydrogenase
LSRAVDAILRTKKKKIAMLGLSFKAGTDDLRESPQVQLIKRLLGEGFQVQIWDENVSVGRLAGSNREYIEDVIPHIGSLLCTDFDKVVRSGEVVIVGTRLGNENQLSSQLLPHQIVIDLVNLESSQRPRGGASYEGICW